MFGFDLADATPLNLVGFACDRCGGHHKSTFSCKDCGSWLCGDHAHQDGDGVRRCKTCHLTSSGPK